MVLPIEEASWYQKGQERERKWQEHLDGFRENMPVLEKALEDGELLYIYTNGFVLLNRPNIKGGILNNDSTITWDLFLKARV